MSHLASMMDTGQMEIRTTLEQVEHNVKALIQEKHDALEANTSIHKQDHDRACLLMEELSIKESLARQKASELKGVVKSLKANEILDALIDALRKNPINLLPDFPQGGIADCTDYNGGARGGRVRVRARIEKLKKHLLKITEIPFGTTTTSLIDSILSANDKSKIKISKIEDNTAEFVEILIHLPFYRTQIMFILQYYNWENMTEK